MFGRNKKPNPGPPPQQFCADHINYIDKLMASILVAWRRGDPTDQEWERVQRQLASWRQPLHIFPQRTEMTPTDDYWYKLIITYDLDGNKNKEFNVESYLHWSWEKHDWELYQTIYYPSGGRSEINNPFTLGYQLSHPRDMNFSQFVGWDIPNLCLDMPSYRTIPVSTEPDIIEESENYESILEVTFEMGGIIKIVRYPRHVDQEAKDEFMNLLNEYNRDIREGYHRATLMSPRIGAYEAMALEYKNWESQRQTLIQNMMIRGWFLAGKPEYRVFDSHYKSEWNKDTGEWNLVDVGLRFQKAGV